MFDRNFYLQVSTSVHFKYREADDIHGGRHVGAIGIVQGGLMVAVFS
jgi:hypothetical protein